MRVYLNGMIVWAVSSLFHIIIKFAYDCSYMIYLVSGMERCSQNQTIFGSVTFDCLIGLTGL